jgi:hypothetical protein
MTTGQFKQGLFSGKSPGKKISLPFWDCRLNLNRQLNAFFDEPIQADFITLISEYSKNTAAV